MAKSKRLYSDFAKAVRRCLLHDDPRHLWKQQHAEIRHVAQGLVGAIPMATLDDIDSRAAIDYAGADAVATRRIYSPLKARIDEAGLTDLLALEMSAIPLLDRMQEIGLLIDRPYFYQLEDEVRAEAAALDIHLARLAGRPINAASGDQVAALLFDELKLHDDTGFEPWLTESGERYSTEDKILEALRASHPIVPLLINRREMTKILGTYIVPIPELVEADGRLHPHFRVTRVETGRLAATKPNVLAIPKGREKAGEPVSLGTRLRRGFIAGPGHVLVSCDLSQIELRILAHLSQDLLLLDIFRRGFDMHADTAHRLLGAPAEKTAQTELQRFLAKKINFGIVMGMTGYGLMQQLHQSRYFEWTAAACQELIDEWYRTYKGAYAYICAKHAEARRYGYVRDLTGRYFYLPVQSRDERVIAGALREAQALPIQSGAQWVVKQWEAAIYREWQGIRAEGYLEPWIQVHDDIVIEADQSLQRVAASLLVSTVPQVLSVPVTSEVKIGETWADLEQAA